MKQLNGRKLLFRILSVFLLSIPFSNAGGASYYYDVATGLSYYYDAKKSRHVIGEYGSAVIGGVTWYYRTFINGNTVSAQIVAGGVKYAGDLTTPALPVESIYDASGNRQGSIYMTQIASSAFSECDRLASLTIDAGVITSIGSRAFYNCSNLGTVTFKVSAGYVSVLTSIGDSAFEGCRSLDVVTIPDGVTSVANRLFYGCEWLTQTTLPSGITKIGESAFYNCIRLASIKSPSGTNVLPSGITSIDDYVFYGCKKLTSIKIPTAVTSIGDYAFQGCSGLTSLTIPGKVKSIGSRAFYKCTGLSMVTIPESVTSVGDYAFGSCTGLKGASIKSKSTRLSISAFSGCSGIDDGSGWGIVGGVVYGYHGDAKSVTINLDITGIGNSAFSNCKELTSVKFNPYSVKEIGSGAFMSCKGLQSVTIPSSVTNIGESAFAACSSLTNMVLPFVGSRRGNTGTRDSLFGYIFGAAVSYVGGVETTQYYSDLESARFFIPTALKNVEITDETTIGYGAFYGCSGLTSIAIPSSVTGIGHFAFAHCGGLLEIEVGSSSANYVSAGGVLFNKDKSELIAYPGGIEDAYTIPLTVTSVGCAAFAGCEGLSSVTIPSTVTKIEASAFARCSSLSSIRLEHLSAPSVNNSAFSGVASNCKIHIKRNSTGWGVSVPGVWKGVSIDYATYTVTLDAQGGTVAESNIIIDLGDPYGTLPIPIKRGYDFEGWYMSRDGGLKVLPGHVPTGDTTLYAHWKPIRYTITYSDLHGAENPNPAQYTIEDEVGFRALENLPGRKFVGWSPVGIPLGSTGTITAKALWEEVRINDVLGETASTGGDASWYVFWDDANQVLRSGAIVKKQSSWMEMSFEDAARVSFEWKASCEDLGGVSERTDGMTVEIDGVEAGFICGETGWIAATHLVSGGGAHKIRWTYSKDGKTDVGEDCAWVRNVTVTPLRSASFNVGGAEEGVAPEAIFGYVGDRYALPDNGTLKKAKHTFVGWQFGNDVLAAGTWCVMPTNDVIYTAVWSAKVLDAPCITAPVIYDEESTFVSISAAEGATIYYTLDGSAPSANNGTRYAGAFRVTGTTKVSAVAVLDDWYDSEVAQVMATRSWTTLADSLGVDDEEFAIATGGAANWIGDKVNACVKSTGDGWLKAAFAGPCVVAWEERTGTGDWCAKRQVFAEEGAREIIWEGASLSVRGLQRLAVRRVDFASGEGTSGEVPQGASPASIYDAAGFSFELPSADGLSVPKHRFAGWKLGESVFAVGTRCVMPTYDVMYVGVWEAKKLSAPVIDVTAQYSTEKTTFSVSQQERANVYYTLDGSDPSSEHGLLYTGVVEIEGSVTIRAVAALDDWFASEVVTASTIRLPWTASECLNATDLVFGFRGDAEWKRDLEESHDGVASMRSGTIGNYQTSEIRTSVTGPGELSFWYKASSECDESDGEPYDGLMVYIDDVAQDELMGGNIQWANVCLKVVGEGDHTVRWVYEKDKSGIGGNDCVWLDEVVWWPLVDPTSPVITSVSKDDTMNVKVSWGKVYGAKSYNVYRSTDNVKPSSASATGINSNCYYDNDATPGVTYFYWVEAVNSVGRAISESANGFRAVALSVASESQCLSAAPGTFFIPVEANTSCVATSPTSWITLKTPSGNLNEAFAYSVAGNTEKAQRSGTIIITAGSVTSHPKTIEISITQEEGPFEILPDGGPYKFKIDEVEWRFYIKDGEATVGGGGNELAGLAVGVGCAGEIVIPDFLGGCPVRYIGKYAFYGCNKLTSVMIPSGVTGIGANAFKGCTGLTSVTIPGCVVMSTVFPSAYSKIEKIVLYDGVTSIPDGAFSSCRSLTSFTIPTSVTHIGEEAFCYCYGLSSITIPSGVTYIGGGAFFCCNELTAITIPSAVTYIGKCAFFECEGLTSITIPSSVEYIGETAFSGCSGLTDLTISEGVKDIDDYAFSACQRLTSVSIPSSMENISKGAFYNCTGLMSVTISEGVSSIGEYAFDNCVGLTSLTIPEGVSSIGGCAFRGCCGLKSVMIPASVTNINYYAFESCVSLTNVTISAGVTGIGWHGFEGCQSLTSIVIPSSVRSIGDGAFYGCKSLSVVTVGKGDVERVKNLYAWPSTVEFVEVDTVSVEGDPGAMVIGDATTGFIIRPTMENMAVEVSIPQDIDAAKVTVEVSPKVATVKPNGATVKVVNGGDDITAYLSMPDADGNGVIDLTKAMVKDEFVNEAMDVEKGAVINLNAANPSLTTPNTRKGLFYQLREGVTLGGMKDGDGTIGDGNPWSPKITVKGGNSAFYSIGVSKGE